MLFLRFAQLFGFFGADRDTVSSIIRSEGDILRAERSILGRSNEPARRSIFTYVDRRHWNWNAIYQVSRDLFEQWQPRFFFCRIKYYIIRTHTGGGATPHGLKLTREGREMIRAASPREFDEVAVE